MVKYFYANISTTSSVSFVMGGAIQFLKITNLISLGRKFLRCVVVVYLLSLLFSSFAFSSFVPSFLLETARFFHTALSKVAVLPGHALFLENVKSDYALTSVCLSMNPEPPQLKKKAPKLFCDKIEPSRISLSPTEMVFNRLFYDAYFSKFRGTLRAEPMVHSLMAPFCMGTPTILWVWKGSFVNLKTNVFLSSKILLRAELDCQSYHFTNLDWNVWPD